MNRLRGFVWTLVLVLAGLLIVLAILIDKRRG